MAYTTIVKCKNDTTEGNNTANQTLGNKNTTAKKQSRYKKNNHW